MRFTKAGANRGNFDIVVTSMLDINFLLIMFFMMTAHFQRETHAQLDLPKERGEERSEVDEAGVVINIDAAGTLIVSGRTVDAGEVRDLVQKQIELLQPTPENPLKIMIRADRQSGTQHLNRVVTVLRELKVGAIRIATEIPA